MIVERIFTSPVSGETQIEHASVEFVAGLGIRGDRYFGRSDEPGQNVTLVEAEEIEAFLGNLGRPCDLSVTNRNLVTRGVRLNELLGKEFTVGGVRMLGVELCEPCLRLGARLASKEITPAAVVKSLVHRGGLRANVLTSGVVWTSPVSVDGWKCAISVILDLIPPFKINGRQVGQSGVQTAGVVPTFDP